MSCLFPLFCEFCIDFAGVALMSQAPFTSNCCLDNIDTASACKVIAGKLIISIIIMLKRGP